jgi:DNA-binding Xre family transcriptional regulator
MLILDLVRVMEHKGIQNPSQFLIKSGFTRHTTHRLINNKVANITYRSMEKLCLLLNCTIDDLFAWKPDANTLQPQKYQLHKLSNRKHKGLITTKLKTLSPDQLEKVQDFLQQMESPSAEA